MDDGFLFWLVILAIAILQGIGQRKKKLGRPGERTGDPRVPSSARTPVPGASTPAESRSGPLDARPRGLGDRPATSEGVIPADVWQEILGLARGGAPGKPRAPTPPPEPASEEVPGYEEGRSYDQEALQVEAPAPRSLSRVSSPTPAPRKAQTATPLHTGTSPAAAASRGVGSRSGRMGGRVESVREDLLARGETEGLRKAIILKEVLGPPVGLRDQGR